MRDIKLSGPGAVEFLVKGNGLDPELLNKQLCSMSINSEPVAINPLEFQLQAEGLYYFTYLVTNGHGLKTGHVSIHYATHVIEFELTYEP